MPPGSRGQVDRTGSLQALTALRLNSMFYGPKGRLASRGVQAAASRTPPRPREHSEITTRPQGSSGPVATVHPLQRFL
jgi:hypothetical protein